MVDTKLHEKRQRWKRLHHCLRLHDFYRKTGCFHEETHRFLLFCRFCRGASDPRPYNFADFNARGGGGPCGNARRDLTPPPGCPASVVVHRCLILAPCLLVMAALAKGTPVAPVPEQVLITAMRDDVVDDGRSGVLALLHALLAERVRLQEQPAGFLPRTVIASAGSRPYFFRMQWPVQITVLGAGGNQCRTAGVLARHLRFGRHQRTRPHSAKRSKPPRFIMYSRAVSTISLKGTPPTWSSPMAQQTSTGFPVS